MTVVTGVLFFPPSLYVPPYLYNWLFDALLLAMIDRQSNLPMHVRKASGENENKGDTFWCIENYLAHAGYPYQLDPVHECINSL